MTSSAGTGPSWVVVVSQAGKSAGQAWEGTHSLSVHTGAHFSSGQIVLCTVSCPRAAGAVGALALTPDPCPSFLLRLAGRRAGVGNGGRPLWLLQPDPRGGAGEGTGQRRRGRPTGWVSEGAAGNERGKSRCRRFPRAGRAGRPPSAGAAAAAASHAARLGARGSGIWVTGPSRALGTLPWPPQKAPALPHVILPSEGFAKGWVFASLKDGCLLAPRSSHHRGEAQPWVFFLPRLTQILPSPTARPLLTVSCSRDLAEWRGFTRSP